MDSNRDISDYYSTIETWVRDFMDTMDSDPEIGDRSGAEPSGVKIIFDGYGYNEETDEEDNPNLLTFAVFIHKESLNLREFPEHDFSPIAIRHRVNEEVCIYTCYDVLSDSFDTTPFEEGNTQLDHLFVYRLIRDLEMGNYTWLTKR